MPARAQLRSPMRTCIGCRQRGEQARLLRVAVVQEKVMPDRGRRLAGRGAYLHFSLQCLEWAIRRGALVRSFRNRVQPPRLEEVHSLNEAVSASQADRIAGNLREQARAPGGAAMSLPARLRVSSDNVVESERTREAREHRSAATTQAVPAEHRKLHQREVGAVDFRQPSEVLSKGGHLSEYRS
jgi:predicted RNA-binding protein YlxR (DUF448 family)